MRGLALAPQSLRIFERLADVHKHKRGKCFVRSILPATRCSSKIFPKFPPKSLIRIDREGEGYFPCNPFSKIALCCLTNNYLTQIRFAATLASSWEPLGPLPPLV
jgi:hypothetical protein